MKNTYIQGSPSRGYLTNCEALFKATALLDKTNALTAWSMRSIQLEGGWHATGEVVPNCDRPADAPSIKTPVIAMGEDANFECGQEAIDSTVELSVEDVLAMYTTMHVDKSQEFSRGVAWMDEDTYDIVFMLFRVAECLSIHGVVSQWDISGRTKNGQKTFWLVLRTPAYLTAEVCITNAPLMHNDQNMFSIDGGVGVDEILLVVSKQLKELDVNAMTNDARHDKGRG